MSLQAIYRGENASVPIHVQNAIMRLPATMEYNIVDIHGKAPTYLEVEQQTGILEWDSELGNVMELELNIDWNNVTLQTEVCPQIHSNL